MHLVGFHYEKTYMKSLSVTMTIDVRLKFPYTPTRGSGVVEGDMSVLQNSVTEPVESHAQQYNNHTSNYTAKTPYRGTNYSSDLYPSSLLFCAYKQHFVLTCSIRIKLGAIHHVPCSTPKLSPSMTENSY